MVQPTKRENHMQCHVIVDFVKPRFRNMTQCLLNVTS